MYLKDNITSRPVYATATEAEMSHGRVAQQYAESASEPSPVKEQYATLETRIAVLNSHADDLEKRLRLVLVPPAPVNETCDPSRGMPTPLLQAMQSLDEQLEVVTRRFSDIFHRIVL